MKTTLFKTIFLLITMILSASACRQKDDTSELAAARYLDVNSNCAYWASIGECRNNPNYMIRSCPNACANNGIIYNQDLDTNCPAWAARGECSRNPSYMRTHCSQSCSGLGKVVTYPAQYAIVDGRRYPICKNLNQRFTRDSMGRLWGWENNVSCLLVR